MTGEEADLEHAKLRRGDFDGRPSEGLGQARKREALQLRTGRSARVRTARGVVSPKMWLKECRNRSEIHFRM